MSSACSSVNESTSHSHWSTGSGAADADSCEEQSPAKSAARSTRSSSSCVCGLMVATGTPIGLAREAAWLKRSLVPSTCAARHSRPPPKCPTLDANFTNPGDNKSPRQAVHRAVPGPAGSAQCRRRKRPCLPASRPPPGLPSPRAGPVPVPDSSQLRLIGKLTLHVKMEGAGHC